MTSKHHYYNLQTNSGLFIYLSVCVLTLHFKFVINLVVIKLVVSQRWSHESAALLVGEGPGLSTR